MELIDIVNSEDEVIGQKGKVEAHMNGDIHRHVHIHLFDKYGNHLVSKRSSIKYDNAGMWDPSVSGHVKEGESYSNAAHRKVKEEYNIETALTPFSYQKNYLSERVLKDRTVIETKHVMIYVGYADGYSPNEEISDIKPVNKNMLMASDLKKDLEIMYGKNMFK